MAKGRGRRTAKAEPTGVLGARAKLAVVELIEAAARIRGIDKNEVIVNGATKEAYRIIAVALREVRRFQERKRRAQLQARRDAAARRRVHANRGDT